MRPAASHCLRELTHVYSCIYSGVFSLDDIMLDGCFYM